MGRVRQAFRGTSSKKSPGPDGVGPLAARCLLDRGLSRITALIRTHIRLRIQRSSVSPVLSTFYITEIYQAVESQMEYSPGISFASDVTYLAEGVDVNDVASKLGHRARVSLARVGR